MHKAAYARETFLTRLYGLDNLPTLPLVVSQVLAIVQDPEFNIRDLQRVIESDPPLAAKVLKVANSAYYSRKNPAKSIDDAIVALGMEGICSVCSTIEIISAFSGFDDWLFDRNQLWKHSVATGLLAESMAKREGIPTKSSMFLAGLLHDIGWIVLDVIAPDFLANALWAGYQSREWSTHLERALIGIDHAEAGGLFLKSWGLPDDIITLVRWHHNTRALPNAMPELYLLEAANSLSPFEFSLNPAQVSFHPELLYRTMPGSTNDAHDELKERYAKDIERVAEQTEEALSWLDS